MAVRGPPSVADEAFFADYPFLPGAERLAQDLAPSIRVLLEDPTLERARELGRARIRAALEDPRGTVGVDELARADAAERFLSFQYARVLLGAAASPAPVRRWAVSESKRASARLELAEPERLLSVAHRLGWEFGLDAGAVAVPVADYVRLATPIREGDFRLSRQRVASGQVLVVPARAARLMEEGIRRTLSVAVELDPSVLEHLRRTEGEFLTEVDRRMPPPQARRSLAGTSLRPEAFPPCIRKMRRTLQEGENLSHAGRFALAAFLHRIGAEPDTIVDSFRGAPDFDEGITRYQVEHITQRDEGRGYDPPECETLRAHGLCGREGDPTSPTPVDRLRDPLCFEPFLKHPLRYYEIRSGAPSRAVAAEAPGRSPAPGPAPSTVRRR
jgi:DNA primase large subunit